MCFDCYFTLGLVEVLIFYACNTAHLNERSDTIRVCDHYLYVYVITDIFRRCVSAHLGRFFLERKKEQQYVQVYMCIDQQIFLVTFTHTQTMPLIHTLLLFTNRHKRANRVMQTKYAQRGSHTSA